MLYRLITFIRLFLFVCFLWPFVFIVYGWEQVERTLDSITDVFVNDVDG